MKRSPWPRQASQIRRQTSSSKEHLYEQISSFPKNGR